ncbi:MAG: short-chain dehydrogenase [Maricaulis sp.]|jgi:NAD(P)-dependent dehydrogenase (short-subunit alcohol dehydrogenase family)|nr:short-chain dehydrogenase [Maricaulis sp.]
MPVTVITGANRGLGLAHAKRYLERGWTVHAACRNPDAADALGALNGKLHIYRYDAASPDDANQLARSIDAPVDLLFANAGVMGAERGEQAFGHVAPDAWIEALRINALGPLMLAQAFADKVAASAHKKIALQSSRMGSIADNSSGSGYVYRPSKAALNAIGKSLAVDLKPRGIAVAILHPGWVQTDMGGDNALLSVEESVAGQQAILDDLTIETSGSFWHQSGEILPW